LGNHAAQNPQKFLSFHGVLPHPFYQFPIIVPRQVFDKTYPVNPQNLGQKLKKARMDSGMQIKELAGILGVTPDTVINWELRWMKPNAQIIRAKVNDFIAEFNRSH
jgi:DNA-binding XRE family transcriptional regulator